jgi:hypothetical protein
VSRAGISPGGANTGARRTRPARPVSSLAEGMTMTTEPTDRDPELPTFTITVGTQPYDERANRFLIRARRRMVDAPA